MAQSTQQAAAAETAAVTRANEQSLRESLEDMPLYRHSHPIPQCRQGCACGSPADGAAILAALEQQNRLLTELRGAVTGLTAACLSRSKPDCG